MTTKELIKEIEDNSIEYLFSYNINLKQNIFMATEHYEDVHYIYNAIQKKLELYGDD